MTVRRSMGLVAAAAAGALAVSVMSTASGSVRATSTDDVDRALAAGAQGVGKHTKRPSVTINGVRARAANPYVGLVPDPSKIDWAYWKSHLARQAEKRYASLKPPTPFVRDEMEPEGTLGSNDSPATAEGIPRFGTAKRKHQAVRILGGLSAPDIEAPDVDTTEDQGSITLASDIGVPADAAGATITSEIGDGPHGDAGTGTGDFDFFKVTATAGQTLTVTTAGSELDTVAAVWDSAARSSSSATTCRSRTT